MIMLYKTCSKSAADVVHFLKSMLLILVVLRMFIYQDAWENVSISYETVIVWSTGDRVNCAK